MRHLELLIASALALISGAAAAVVAVPVGEDAPYVVVRPDNADIDKRVANNANSVQPGNDGLEKRNEGTTTLTTISTLIVAATTQTVTMPSYDEGKEASQDSATNVLLEEDVNGNVAPSAAVVATDQTSIVAAEAIAVTTVYSSQSSVDTMTTAYSTSLVTVIAQVVVTDYVNVAPATRVKARAKHGHGAITLTQLPGIALLTTPIANGQEAKRNIEVVPAPFPKTEITARAVTSLDPNRIGDFAVLMYQCCYFKEIGACYSLMKEFGSPAGGDICGLGKDSFHNVKRDIIIVSSVITQGNTITIPATTTTSSVTGSVPPPKTTTVYSTLTDTSGVSYAVAVITATAIVPIIAGSSGQPLQTLPTTIPMPLGPEVPVNSTWYRLPFNISTPCPTDPSYPVPSWSWMSSSYQFSSTSTELFTATTVTKSAPTSENFPGYSAGRTANLTADGGKAVNVNGFQVLVTMGVAMAACFALALFL